MSDAIVVGAGPNGLVAADHLLDAGWTVEVFEGASTPGDREPVAAIIGFAIVLLGTTSVIVGIDQFGNLF